VFRQVTVKNNAFGGLFSDDSKHVLAGDFRAFFVKQVGTLAGAKDANSVAYPVEDRFNSGQSSSMGEEMNYPGFFNQEGEFGKEIAAVLSGLQSTLQPIHIVRRAMANTCGGCHQLSQTPLNGDLGGGIMWPSSLGFVHVSEQNKVRCNGNQRCARLSPALEKVFLPARKTHMQGFLARRGRGERTDPVSNRREE
jgi:hypothetical protein